MHVLIFLLNVSRTVRGPLRFLPPLSRAFGIHCEHNYIAYSLQFFIISPINTILDVPDDLSLAHFLHLPVIRLRNPFNSV